MSSNSSHPLENCQPSQFDKFWKTYYSAFNWSYQHQIANLQAQVKSLEYENFKLQEYIKMLLDKDHGRNHQHLKFANKYRPKRRFGVANKCKRERPSKRERKRRKKKLLRERVNQKITSSDIEEESDYYLGEEMVEFLEKNIKYRLEKDKEKLMEVEDNKPSPEVLKQQEMKNLFGSAAPKIAAMEMAMQIKYDHICEQQKPVEWPIVPLTFR